METKKKVFMMLVEDQCDIWWWAGDSLESVIARYENGSFFCEKGKDYIIEEVNPALFNSITVRCAEASVAGKKADFLLSDYMEHLASTNFFDKYNPDCFLSCYIKD